MASDLILDIAVRVVVNCAVSFIVDPWCYLLSPKFRRSKHEEWARSRWRGAFEIVFGSIGLILGIAIVAYIVSGGLTS